MRLIKQYATIISDEGTLKNIEKAARTCYMSQDKITEDESSAKKMVTSLVNRRHYAMLEFGNDIKIAFDDFEAQWFFNMFATLPLFKSLEFYELEGYGEKVVIINPRAALEIIEFLEINEKDREGVKYWSDYEYILYNTLLSNLDECLIGERKLNNTYKTFSIYTGSVGDKEKVAVRIITNRGVTHELVRHRHCSFAQRSTRYVEDKEDIEFIEPLWLTYEQYPEEDFEHHLRQIEGHYKQLRESGWQKQQAREILPNALKTEIIVKATIEEWQHIFELRTALDAHPQIRALMIDLREKFKEENLI